jgi:hypothetical protein
MLLANLKSNRSYFRAKEEKEKEKITNISCEEGESIF